MSVQIDWDFAGDADAKAEIGAAVRSLLRDATGSARDKIVREIMEIVREAANGPLPPQHADPLGAGAAKQRIPYKAYVIDAFQRDTDRWRATIRKLDGKKIRITFPLSVSNEFTTSADALTAEKAVEHAKNAIDQGELV